MTTTLMMDPLAYLMMHLRESDVLELAECGRTPIEAFEALRQGNMLQAMFAAPLDGMPAAIVAFKELTPKTLSVALLASDQWPLVARTVFRWGLKVARPDLLYRGYVRAECRTMEGHHEAIRMLEHLGFRRELRLAKYGSSGRAFLQYAWRLNDHFLETPAIREPFVSQRPRQRPRPDQPV